MGRDIPIDGSEEASSENRIAVIHDEEDILRKPLLADSRTDREQSNAVADNSMETIVDSKKLWRSRSLPSVFRNESLLLPFRGSTSSYVLRSAIFGVVIYFAIGIIFCYVFEGDLYGSRTTNFIDALYFCVVTLTTVGYGDLVPSTTKAKLFTCIYAFVGFGLVGALLSGGAHYLVSKQEQLIVSALNRLEEKDQTYETNSFDVQGKHVPEDEDVRAAHWKALVAGMLCLALFVMGITFLVHFEELGVVDAFYCVCVTVTTLGYGDRNFKTQTGRLFASIWILASTACVAQFFLFLAEVVTERQQQSLAKWALYRRTTRSDIEAADLDGDGVVSAPEFVIYKLKELGKIDEDDVISILRQFRHLDYDRSGSISITDLNLAQPS